jgi:hypothetical protein
MTGPSPRDPKSVGGWLAVLTHSHLCDGRRRWQRVVAYVLLAQAAAAAVLILGARDTLAAQATIGLLFPVVVWVGVRIWRAMTTCSLIAVALDDIAVSVMLGLPLMALLVWMPDRLDCRDIELLADALHIPPAGVATVRETLRLAGKYAELPQRWWLGLYVLLVGVSVLFAVRPGLLPAMLEWFPRMGIMPSFIVDHQVATGMHIELLIAAATPAPVMPALKARPAARYREILAENLPEHGKLVAHPEFRNAVNVRPAAARVATLCDFLTHIDKANRPAPNRPLNWRLGRGEWRRSGQPRCSVSQLV